MKKNFKIELNKKNLNNMLDCGNFLTLLEIVSSANKFCRRTNKSRSQKSLLDDLKLCISYLDEISSLIIKGERENNKDFEVILEALHITRKKLTLKRDDLFSRLETTSSTCEVTVVIAEDEKMKVSRI